MAETPHDPADPQPAGTDAPAAAPTRSFARRHWGKLTVFTILFTPAAVFALWCLIALNWSYSTGQRSGYVQKISYKGFVCKTWEGTLYTDIAKGFRADSFSFTVRSDSLAQLLEKYGGKKVDVHYEQHIALPTSCFGDTQYFVSAVTPIPD